MIIDDENVKVGCMVDREAGPREKVVPGWKYAFDSDALRRFCARPKSDRCHCKYCWNKFELVGSWSSLIGVWVNIKRVNDRLCGPCYMGTSWVGL